MECTNCSVLVGCNRVVGALAWGNGGLAAFGASNVIALFDPKVSEIVGVLNGHTGPVNCVKWLDQTCLTQSSESVILSGSSDCSIRVWAVSNESNERRCLAILEGHKSGVTDLAWWKRSDGSLLVVSTSCDEFVAVWEASQTEDLTQDSWRLKQKIPVGFKVQHCVAVGSLPNDPDCLLMALGGTDTRIHLYFSDSGGDFHPSCQLVGHQDWVRGLQFHHVRQGEPGGERLLLASAAGDRYVRVWSAQVASGRDAGGSLASLSRLAPSSTIRTSNHSYSIVLESLLIGHEDWVHSVDWQPPTQSPSERENLRLLSASMDRTMIIWEYDEASKLWMNKESVGDAGSGSLGYFGGVFSPDGQCIMSHGFTGALHLWEAEGDGEGCEWIPRPAVTGHYGEVVDMTWAIDGQCLMTVSTDQTTRIISKKKNHWYEMARPQVHGHDFFGVSAVPCRRSDGSYTIASCSEEKVIRVFTSPGAFHETLGQKLTSDSAKQGKKPLGARVKALGLTNMSVFGEGTDNADVQASSMEDALEQGQDGYADGPDVAPNATPIAVEGPPLEEHLCQNTLWPEAHKLYGHGDNVFSLACDPAGEFLASACKAQAADVAMIWIWDTKSWGNVAKLQAHTLTVTQMEFSRDGRYLLSGSRDRSFCVFERQVVEGGVGFKLMKRVAKAHGRIIWGVGWSPDGKYFATGSRDQSVKVWAMHSDGPTDVPIHVLKLKSSVTALAFAPTGSLIPNGFILAVGIQSGAIQVHLLRIEEKVSSELMWSSNVSLSHGDAVRRIRWQDGEDGRKLQGLRMATCSNDHSVRIFELAVTR
ncbi:hypothetical protein BSKO_03363 [Bryopsis sp. KO-2023]|nr:hypothetical protein BSKO_03363 [Bryopsis sp. KO-2023]